MVDEYYRDYIYNKLMVDDSIRMVDDLPRISSNRFVYEFGRNDFRWV